MPTFEEMNAKYGLRPGGGAPAVRLTPPPGPSPFHEQAVKQMEEEGGMGGAEAVLSVLDLVAPAIAGAVDPTTTAMENLLTPANSRRRWAEALQNFARENAPSMLTKPRKINKDTTFTLYDLMSHGPEGFAWGSPGGELRPELKAAASVGELLAPPLIPGIGLLKTTKAGKAAQLAGTLANKTIPAQVKAGERALVSVNPALGLEKLISKASFDIPVPIPMQAEIVQKGADAAAALGRGVLKVPYANRLVRTMLPPGPEAAVSANRAVREAEPAFRDTLESAAREHVAKLGEQEDLAARLLKDFPESNRPEVVMALTEAPLAAAERKVVPLRDAADAALDASARELIGGVSAGIIAAKDLPPSLRVAASNFVAAQERMNDLRKAAEAHVDDVLSQAGYDVATIRQEAREAAQSLQGKVTAQTGATPVVTSGPTRGAQAVTEGKPLDVSGGGKGSFDFETAYFQSELEKDILNRRLDKLYRGQAQADPTYTRFADALEQARQQFGQETAKVMRETDTFTKTNIGQTRRLMRALQKRQEFLSEAERLTKSGTAELRRIESTLTDNDRALISEIRSMLGGYQGELQKRGILNMANVDPTITGKRYLPVVPRAAGEEAKQVRAVIDAEYAKTGVHPDQIAQSYGYKDYMQVFDLEKNAPKQVLSTAIGKPTTPNVKRRAVPIETAVQDPKTYFEGVVAPAFIGAARSEQAIRSYDTLEKLYDTAQQSGIVKVIDPTDPLQVAKLGDYARLPFGDVFEPAFAKTRGLPAGHEIYVPKDLANMVEQYLNPKGVGEMLQRIQKAQQALVPIYTTLRPKFTTSNNLSGQLFNVMHLGTRGMAQTLGHMPTTFETARVLSGEGRAALRNPANQKLLSTVIETDAGPVRVSQLMDEMLTQGVVGQGVRGSEYVEKVGGKVGVNTKTPWNERIPVGKQLARGADIIETHNRVQGYIGQRLMGASPKEAARQTLKWQVDYSKPLSQEAKFVRVFSPFFRWYQAQVPNMVKAIMAQPTTVRGMLKAPQMVEATVNTPEENRKFRKTQPAYSRDRGDVNVTGLLNLLKADDPETIGSWYPRGPGPGEFSTLDIVTKPPTAQYPVEALGDAVLREFGHRFGPVPTVAAGLLMNRDTFRQREIRKNELAPPAAVDLANSRAIEVANENFFDPIWDTVFTPFSENDKSPDFVEIDPKTGRYTMGGKTLFALRQIPGAEELLMKAPASALAAYKGESPVRTGVSGRPSEPADDTVAASIAYMLSLLGLNVSAQSAAEREDAARRAEVGRLYRERDRPVPIRR